MHMTHLAVLMHSLMLLGGACVSRCYVSSPQLYYKQFRNVIVFEFPGIQ